MKTLKKVLSVALVLAMALSLMTIAGAAEVSRYQDFTDAADIKNAEAVDTLTALGIINGMGDGTFAPEGTFTRAQAAKVITYLLLGASSANNLKASAAPFSDVPVSHWAAPFIQFCSVKGIINGLGDGSFSPEGEVTAAQFAKMLLVAAGYGKKSEYVGSDWAINAIVDAQNLKILDTNVDYMAPANRDEVARYAFNFYTKVEFVNFSKDLEAYKVIDGANKTLAAQQSVAVVNGYAVNGVASHHWTKNGLRLTDNAFADTLVKVLASSNDGTALTALTTPGSVGFKAKADGALSGLDYYLNGTASNYAALESKIDLLAYGRRSASRGVIVQLLDTTGNGLVDTVAVIEKQVVTLTGDAYVSATGLVTVPGIPGCAAQAKEAVVGYQGLKKDDVVLFYKDSNNIFHIEKAKSVSGQLTQGNATSLTFGGGVYFASGLTAVDTAVNFATIVGNYANFNMDATVWLDNSGSVVKFALVSKQVSLPYAVLIGYQYDTFAGTALAKIVKEDGVLATYSVAVNATGAVPNQSSDFAGALTTRAGGSTDPYGYLVKYYLNDDGKVAIYKVTDSKTVAATGYAAKDAKISVTAAPTTLYMTKTTKVFYFDWDNPYSASNRVVVTTGYTNTDDVAGGKTVSYSLAPNTTNVVDAVLFGAVGEIETSKQFVFATLYSGHTVTYNAAGVATYHYNVYMNGEFKTLKSADPFEFGNPAAVAGLYEITTNENGYITDVSTANTRIKTVAAGGSDTYLVEEGYIVLDDGTVIVVDENTKFYQYDTSNPMAPISAKAISVSSTYVHYNVTTYLMDKDNEVATQVYFTYTID